MSLQCNGSPVLTQHEKLKTIVLVTVFLVVCHSLCMKNIHVCALPTPDMT